MLRRFVKDISIYGILPIVGKFLNFLLVPIYTRIFSPEEYGVIDLYEAFVFFLLVIASFEIPTAMGRYFYDENSMEHRRKVVNTSLYLAIFFTLITILTAIIFKKKALALFLGGANHSLLFNLSMLWLFTLAINTFLSFIPRYDNRPKVYVTVGIAAILIKLLFSVLFVVGLREGLIGVLYGYMCGNIASILMYIWVSRHYFRFAFSSKYALKILYYCLPLLLGVVMMELWKPWLRHLITLYFPIAVVGFYAFAIRLTSVNMIVHGALKTAWKPLLFEKKRYFVKDNVMKRMSGLFLLASVVFGCMIVCFAKEATLLIGRKEYLQSVQLTALLSFSGIIKVMCEMRGFGPYISDKTLVVTVANFISILAATIFFILVVDTLGVMSIGCSCIIYDSICYIIIVSYTRMRYSLKLHNIWEIPLAIILFACVVLSCSSMQLKYRILAAIVAVLYTAYLFYTHYYKVNLKLRRTKGV